MVQGDTGSIGERQGLIFLSIRTSTGNGRRDTDARLLSLRSGRIGIAALARAHGRIDPGKANGHPRGAVRRGALWREKGRSFDRPSVTWPIQVPSGGCGRTISIIRLRSITSGWVFMYFRATRTAPDAVMSLIRVSPM